MQSDAQQLIMEVMDGNPGAFTIIRELMTFPTWYQLLHHLKNQHVIGSALWQVVKDDYSHDVKRFVEDQLACMRPERARTLRSLGRDVSFRDN
jgi:hypothetical protein